MQLNAILCNHAEVQNNLLFLSGGGINRANVPAGAVGPYGVSVGIGITLNVPWMATNQQHTLTVTLVDADERPVEVQTGPETKEQLKAEMSFNLGRPPDLQTGEEQTVSLAVNFPGFPMPTLGRYSFVLSLDGAELQRLPFAVVAQGAVTYSLP